MGLNARQTNNLCIYLYVTCLFRAFVCNLLLSDHLCMYHYSGLYVSSNIGESHLLGLCILIKSCFVYLFRSGAKFVVH